MFIPLTNEDGDKPAVNIDHVVVIVPMEQDCPEPRALGSELTFGPNDDYAHLWVRETVEAILSLQNRVLRLVP